MHEIHAKALVQAMNKQTKNNNKKKHKPRHTHSQRTKSTKHYFRKSLI